jgi:hypothetical protein
MKMTYDVSRAALAVILGGALCLGGLPWWGAAPASILVLAFLLTARRSGRYVVQSEDGIAPLRRDERSRAIRDKAARNAFIVTVLAVAGLSIAYGRVLDAAVPGTALSVVLALAVVAYAVSDFYLRRSS